MRQPRQRAVAHRDRRRAVQLDHRRRIGADEDVVERDDLRPVGRRRRRRLGVHRGDRRLQRVRTEPPQRQGALDERRSFRDLIAVPRDAILIGEQNQLAVGRRARGAARLVQQHQREQPDRLGLRQQLDQQPSEPDRLARQIVPRQRLARRGEVALVEHQVDDVQDAVEAIGETRPAPAPDRESPRRESSPWRGRCAGRRSTER